MEPESQQYTYFWGGPLSQWQKSKFKYNDIEFNCCEQFMMYYKAIRFNDSITATSILKSTDPKIIKCLGRQVIGFNDAVWNSIKENIVYNGNLAKFSQNSHLLKHLKATTGIIVEASPYDKIWGIGLSETDARCTPSSKWPGKNLLGLILTRVRDAL